ncbi:MAG TPA: hypothetical protein VF933_17295 [Streptosporangiaceae bacterium]
MAGQDGMDREPELVDQAVLQQRVRQRAVTEQGEVRAVLLPEPGYLGCCVTPEDGRVVPAGLVQGRREDVLADADTGLFAWFGLPEVQPARPARRAGRL